jgi:hypothetical protein
MEYQLRYINCAACTCARGLQENPCFIDGQREVNMLRKISVVALMFCGSLLLSNVSFAQDVEQVAQPAKQIAQPAASSAGLDEQIALMRLDLRSNRKKVIAANMKLAPDEGRSFWPTFDQYVKELVQINNAKYDLIKEYLQNENMTDEQANTLPKRWVEVDESVVQLRLKYIPIFRKVLSAKSAAMFFQLDRRVQMMIDLQLLSSLPLVQPCNQPGPTICNQQ